MTSPPIPPDDAPPAASPDAAPACRRDRVWLTATLAGLSLVYGLLLNPWWVPAGDSEVFLVLARNLLGGGGYLYNGEVARIVPPGWPLVLAGLMALSDSYLLPKAVAVTCMVGSGGFMYGVLRQGAGLGPRVSGTSVLLGGSLSPAWPLTYWLHTDALFCLLASSLAYAGVRLAGRADGVRGPLLVATAGAGAVALMLVRWAALPHAIFLSAVLLTGGLAGRRAGYRWLAVAVLWVATLGTYATWAAAGGGHAPLAASVSSASSAAEPVPIGGRESELPPLLVRRENPDLTAAQEYLQRLRRLPQWLSWTFWQPMRVVGSAGGVGAILDSGSGLLAGALILGAAATGARRGRYVLAGAALFVVGLGLNWPHVNNRYLVPVAPVLVAGVLAGLDGLRTTFPGVAAVVPVLLARAFVYAVLLVNGLLWSVDVWVMRSASAEDFYARYEAGIHLPLIEIGHYLAADPAWDDAQVAASGRYVNLNERFEYRHAQRAAAWMTGRIVLQVPRRQSGSGVRTVQQWARDHDLRYYIHKNPTMPGRAWHLRLTPEEHERVTGYAPDPPRPQFELFETGRHPDYPDNPEIRWLHYRPVPVLRGEALDTWTRRMPGLPPPPPPPSRPERGAPGTPR